MSDHSPEDTPPPSTHVAGRWLPIDQADKTINHVTEFTQIGLTLKNSDTFWVRDEDGRTYQAAWSEGNNGRDYWWDWEGESPVDPVEFMPHPLDPRWSATTEEHDFETSSPPGNQIRTAECDGKDAVPVTGQLPVGTASTKFPPSCCTAWEDCNHDGICHDPQYCGAVGPSALATTEGSTDA